MGKYDRYKNKEWIIEQYINQKKSLSQICKEFGIYSSLLNKWLIEFNISKRTPEECAQLQTDNGKRLYRNKEWLNQQYTINKKSCSTIAKELNCDLTTILYWLRKYGIHVRTNSESHMGRFFGDPDSPKRLAARIRNSGDNHPMKRPEVRAKVIGLKNGMNQPGVREKHLAIVNDPSYKENKRQKVLKMWEDPERRKQRSEQMSGKNHPNYGKPPSIGTQWSKGSWYIFPNKSRIWIRSPYEVRVIESLDILNIKWEYECISFELGELGTWRPDFYLPDYDVWWEVKGYMREEARNKILQFTKLYPDKILRILYLDDIIELECYADNKWSFEVSGLGSDICDS